MQLLMSPQTFILDDTISVHNVATKSNGLEIMPHKRQYCGDSETQKHSHNWMNHCAAC